MDWPRFNRYRSIPRSTASFEQASFNDVPFNYSETLGGVTYPLHAYIQALYDNGFTAGTSTNPPLFSPTVILDRAQSSVFMLRGAVGTGYTPPDAPWNTFGDNWGPGPWAEKWAEGMWAEGLTAGCQASPLRYCPWIQLPRVQAVIFGLKMERGNSYTPSDALGTVFADMTDPGFYGTKWAEQAYADGLLPACGASGGKPLFCPNSPVDRAWAAYLIVQARSLPLP